jgi:protein-S-isoprenylcysteine O-methyltransferase Ste14
VAAYADPTVARKGARRWIIRETLGVATVAAILMVSAGRWDWAAGWGLTAIYAIWVGVTAVLIMPRHPALLAERATRRPERGWYKIILSAIGLLTTGAYVAAGLDVRNAWGPDMPDLMQWAGGAIALVGYLLVVLSMRANAFFSTVARIQADRGQTVATGGPYRAVRHPGYVGAAAFALGAPVVLGSWVALPLGVLSAALVVLRTALEDRMLLEELEGYAAYADQIPWRLIPGLW